MDKQDVVFPYNGILFRQKSNKVLMYSAMQMDLKNIMLIERSPLSHILIDFIYVKNLESRLVVASDWGRE